MKGPMILKDKTNPLDPSNFVHSAYGVDRIPPPTLDELAALGIKPEDAEKNIKVSTSVRPSIVLLIDRIIERRAHNFKSRQEVFRTALMNMVSMLQEDLQSDHLSTLVRRLESEREMWGQLMQFNHAIEMLSLVRRNVQTWIQYGNPNQAIKRLRNAKRYMVELPTEGLRDKFKYTLYGDPKGEKIPDGWEEMESAVLWDKVLSGELDRDDEDDVLERMKLR